MANAIARARVAIHPSVEAVFEHARAKMLG
jgi:hypothetical protein